MQGAASIVYRFTQKGTLMSISGLGYDKDLFILPFDHRSSFEEGLLGIKRRPADTQEIQQLAAYKRVIYDGFLQAIDQGVPVETAAILVDQKYGEEILADANARSITTCTSVEKSGQPGFDLEYGDGFAQRLRDASPTFAKPAPAMASRIACHRFGSFCRTLGLLSAVHSCISASMAFNVNSRSLMPRMSKSLAILSSNFGGLPLLSSTVESLTALRNCTHDSGSRFICFFEVK